MLAQRWRLDGNEFPSRDWGFALFAVTCVARGGAQRWRVVGGIRSQLIEQQHQRHQAGDGGDRHPAEDDEPGVEIIR